jgi:hypothetical protein
LEEAELMKRLYNRGKKIVVEMRIKSRMEGTCTSRNTIFDIKGNKYCTVKFNINFFIFGSVYPEQIVLLSAHMDSWDVGQGALDDGGGMAAVWQAMDTLRRFAKLDPVFVPKRYDYILLKYLIKSAEFNETLIILITRTKVCSGESGA